MTGLRIGGGVKLIVTFGFYGFVEARSVFQCLRQRDTMVKRMQVDDNGCRGKTFGGRSWLRGGNNWIRHLVLFIQNEDRQWVSC